MTILCALIFTTTTSAEEIERGKTILYIPIDNRPVNDKQTVEVAEKSGYEILVPPNEYLGTGADPEQFGNPDELWLWLYDNAPVADAVVISTDAMIYGSLVGSRQHEYTADEILDKASRFTEFHEDFPHLPIYAFGTIMRTPRYGSNARTEPEYYKQYGAMIFNYTALKDKAEMGVASNGDRQQMTLLEKQIPDYALEDWFGRRALNYDANEYFVDLTRQNVFEYFLIGCDDSAIFSQTHLESRRLTDYSNDLGKTRCIVMSGADELGMLMLARAINIDREEFPLIAVEYNIGKGGETIPAYCNEKISDSIEGAIISVGGMRVPDPKNADLVLVVNTNPNGKTFEGGSKRNKKSAHSGIGPFVKLLKNSVDSGYNVGVVDIAYSNGSDNALMNKLKQNNLQFRIKAYGGWNTATNASGFLIGAGTLTKWMNDRDVNSLLMTRYLDEWGYQANIRQALTNGLFWTVPGEGNFNKIDGKREGINALMTELMIKFVNDNIKLPTGYAIEELSVTSPWNRTFESESDFNLVAQ